MSNFLARMLLAATFCGMLATVAFAQSAPINNPAPLTAPTCVIAVTTPVVCTVPVKVNGTVTNTPAQLFLGVFNNSTTAQTYGIACYDNATTTSGQGINIGALGVSQLITWPGTGRRMVNGVVCQAQGAVNITGPGATGIEVYVR